MDPWSGECSEAHGCPGRVLWPVDINCNVTIVNCMPVRTVGFAVAEKDLKRLDHLAQKFGDGNRSAFLREAMHQMEVVDRAQRLVELQRYGSERAVELASGDQDPISVVRRVLKAHS